jgi:hypothetical protein
LNFLQEEAPSSEITILGLDVGVVLFLEALVLRKITILKKLKVFFKVEYMLWESKTLSAIDGREICK